MRAVSVCVSRPFPNPLVTRVVKQCTYDVRRTKADVRVQQYEHIRVLHARVSMVGRGRVYECHTEIRLCRRDHAENEITLRMCPTDWAKSSSLRFTRTRLRSFLHASVNKSCLKNCLYFASLFFWMIWLQSMNEFMQISTPNSSSPPSTV
jgi:hypothetical protein